MQSTELWAIYVRRNPAFEESETITMTKAGLRKFFEQTYEKAHRQGFDNGVAWQERQPKASIFEQMFGGK